MATALSVYTAIQNHFDESLPARRLAALDRSLVAAQWPAVLEYTGLPWMKQHATKFDSLSSEVPPLKPGAMVRKGKAGVAQEDGMTAAIAQDLRQIGQQMCADSSALRWFYQGGALS